MLLKHEERLPHLNFEQDTPQAQDLNLMIPIHYAVQRNNYQMVKFLIENKSEEIAIGTYKKEGAIQSNAVAKKNLSKE